MTNGTRALLIGVTVGVIAGTGAARVYYRSLPGMPPTPLSVASVSLDPVQAFKQRVAELNVARQVLYRKQGCDRCGDQ